MEKRRRGPQAQRPYVCCISLALDVTNFSFALLPYIYIFSSNEIAVVCVFFNEIVFTFSHMHGCNQQVARAGAKGSPKERAAIASHSKFS